MTSPFTDRERLVSQAYGDASNLSARQALHAFRRPGPGFHDRLVDLVDWSATATVIDVGCGNAIYLDRLMARLPAGATVVGLDLSLGMLVSASHPSGRIVADAQALPVVAGAADVVLALHMLYHVPDPARAVSELRRVVRRGGLVVVSTNGPRHLAELIELGDRRVLRGSRTLGLDRAGELLSSVFGSVERHDFIDELVVTEVGPVIAYLHSTISLGGDPSAVALVERRVHEALARGPLVLTVHPGALLCRG
jgi:SAM-dependent methyltransferase